MPVTSGYRQAHAVAIDMQSKAAEYTVVFCQVLVAGAFKEQSA